MGLELEFPDEYGDTNSDADLGKQGLPCRMGRMQWKGEGWSLRGPTLKLYENAEDFCTQQK